jgi:molecular chaperone HscB
VAVASLSISEGLAASRLMPCWSCKGPVDVRALFCSVCGAVQGPGTLDHFSRLGLIATYDLDADHLDHQYFGFQRRMHPDRFAARSAKEKALSQAQATALNDAYEILSDPVKRAHYLLWGMARVVTGLRPCRTRFC